MPRPCLALLLLLSACAPDAVGQRVGQSLYDASVSTGHALAVAGDRTGQVLQSAGANLRNAVSPPPPAYAPPPELPPAYVPDGYAPDGYAPVTAAPLDPPSGTPPNPAVGY